MVPNDEEIKRKVLELHYDHPLAGHGGQTKTLELVTRTFYWPSMKKYVNQYVEGCEQCRRSKIMPRKPHGPLQPLPILKGPWKEVTQDFIVKLPTSRGFDSIHTIIDRNTKMVHFIPVKESITTLEVGDQLIKEVIRLHGVPETIVSDRGPQFTREMLMQLYQHLGIKPLLSTAYHPQTDGQSERTNQIVEQYLRIFCFQRQDDWADLLPLAEFTYNNTS